MGAARCGCEIGGIHRWACAHVGHVDPPREAAPTPEGVVLGAEEAAARAALDYLVNMANGHDYADPMKIMDAEDTLAARLAAERAAHEGLRAAVEALADQWQEAARQNERGGHFPWAMWQNRSNDLRAALAAGVRGE